MKKKFLIFIVTYQSSFRILNIMKKIKKLDLKKDFYKILISDDCSTDDSIKVIKKFRKIKLIKNLRRKNKSGPHNQIIGILQAFKKSKGKIICLMD